MPNRSVFQNKLTLGLANYTEGLLQIFHILKENVAVACTVAAFMYTKQYH
uniref:Uncharacterized protein n=1 Tax=Anguilla anguilla TaxID=7936 RepID=A0A0E9UGA8_ANGAN